MSSDHRNAAPAPGLARATGSNRRGQELACERLTALGLRIVARNWRCRTGEIDVVAAGPDLLVFCEVKTRRGHGYGTPAEAVTPAKRARLRQLAAAYLAAVEHPACRVRFDVVAVHWPRGHAPLVGLVAHPVGVEVDIGRGLPSITVVGLGDTAVLQARDRIRAAFGNSGFRWPDRRITISLPPADLPKQGSGFDLPIAIGLLAAAELVPSPALDGLWAIGELGLGGDLRPVRGVLASALAARRAGARTLLVPSANLAEAALVPGLRAAGASTLGEVSAW